MISVIIQKLFDIRSNMVDLVNNSSIAKACAVNNMPKRCKYSFVLSRNGSKIMHGLAVRLHFHFHDTLPRIKLYKGHKKESVSYLLFPISPQSVQWTLVANLRLEKKIS